MFSIRRLASSRVLVALATAAVLISGPGAITSHSASVRADNSILTIGWNTETKTLDPVNNPQNPDIWVQVNIFDRLVKVGNDGKTIESDLATSWSSNEAGTVYTFNLRPNVVFHNGQKLTASDVKFCLDRARNPKAAWSWTLKAVKSVSAPHPSTVVVTLKYPWAPFISDVSLFDAGIYPAAYYKKVGASYMSGHPIGTGPYMFDQWKKGQYLRLKKNPQYWWASKYPMQAVEYDLIPNDTTRTLKVQAGELDVDNLLPYNQIAQLQKSGSAQVQINTATKIIYLVPNNSIPPLNDVNVRQAINHAIDRNALVRAILFGHGVPANSFMPRGAIDYDPNIPVPTYDLKLAKQYLAKSKAPHGFTMTMEVGSGDTVDNETAVIFKSEMAALGIKINLKQMDVTTLFNDSILGKYHMTTGDGGGLWTNDIPDPDELVSFAMDGKSGNHFFDSWYNNPQSTKLSEQAEHTNNQATRKQLYFKIQEIWAHDAPFFALYYPPFVNAVSNKVHGFSENPLGYFNLEGVTKSS
jgi:peptide/nickel transport system substrate-binding protein